MKHTKILLEFSEYKRLLSFEEKYLELKEQYIQLEKKTK